MVDFVDYAGKHDAEPPFVRHFSNERLLTLVETPLQTDIPCHTQSTERSVKLTTEAAAAIKGTKHQDGHSLNKVAFRRRNGNK